ncbi:hypothetical protein CLU79DRAFT_400753 [Phycomyces nitens]|nr:hypothetical protein CLU79DRAFT_400753 [Phycomyces nitens]
MALYESAGSKKPEVSKKKPKPKIKKAKKTALPVKTEQKRDNQDMVDKKEKLPCRYWTNNRCQQGDKCPFLHEGQPLVTVCRYFKSNSCYNGESCPFSHDLKLEPCRFFHVKGVCENGAICPFSHEPLTRDLRRRLHQSTGPCRFFHFKGFCNDGEECLFSHEPINADQRADLESTLELCKHYHLSGACKKGDDCFFLHGEASERARQRFMENHKANNLKPQAPFNQELE